MRNLMQCVGCLALAAVLFTGAPARADEKKEDKQKQERDLPIPDLEKLLEALGGSLDAEQLKELRGRMDQMREMMKQLQKGGGLQGGFGFGLPDAKPARRVTSQETRLGAKLREPSAAMVDQLDLPKNQGLVLDEVGPNSPAAKAGLKAHDVLLEVNGKTVPSKKDDGDKVLAGVEANKAVDVVVMRKGKKETLKGLKLPEAKRAAASR